jgi:hypothetical protein
MHRELIAVLDGSLDLIEIAEVDMRVDALTEKIQPEGYQVNVSGALAVTEQAALDTVCAGKVAELSGCNPGAAIVVRV